MSLINWHWLEDMVTDLFAREVRDLAASHAGDPFACACLELDEEAAAITFSTVTRAELDLALAGPISASGARALELSPDAWPRPRPAPRDPMGLLAHVQELMAPYLQAVREPDDAGRRLFYTARMEFTLACIRDRIQESGAVDLLPRTAEFLYYSFRRGQSLEELEDRLELWYPRYRRATVEWSPFDRPGRLSRHCAGCRRFVRGPDRLRCTACHDSFCRVCRPLHLHPELMVPVPFFVSG
jgi:hypothetical protein